MKALDRQIPYGRFLEQLEAAPQRLLLLDYDGTMAPFTVDRDHAFPYPEIPELLSRIIAEGTKVVLVTGRPARDLVLLSGMQPHLEIWGSHGFERLMPDGTLLHGHLAPEQETSLLTAAETLRHAGLELQMELKPAGVALHWRGFTPLEIYELKANVLQLWQPLLADPGLRLLEFDGGIELRTSGTNKGNAVNSILREAQAGAAVAYLGDDQTDEDAFLALQGRGLPILVRPEPRPTAAEIWLKPPEELIEFLQQWLKASGGEA